MQGTRLSRARHTGPCTPRARHTGLHPPCARDTPVPCKAHGAICSLHKRLGDTETLCEGHTCPVQGTRGHIHPVQGTHLSRARRMRPYAPRARDWGPRRPRASGSEAGGGADRRARAERRPGSGCPRQSAHRPSPCGKRRSAKVWGQWPRWFPALASTVVLRFRDGSSEGCPAGNPAFAVLQSYLLVCYPFPIAEGAWWPPLALGLVCGGVIPT